MVTADIELPPSVNHLYFQRGGIRILSTEGKRYKFTVKNTLARKYPDFIRRLTNAKLQQEELEMLFVLNFAKQDVYCETYGKKSGVFRHKKIDASNRVKILEDSISEASGCDDKQNWRVSVAKQVVAEGHEPYVRVYVWGADEDGPVGRFLKDKQDGAVPALR